MTTYDRMVFGHRTLNITQIGSGYDGKSHFSHIGYELDLAGEDAGVDVWRNEMPNTLWYCAGSFGNSSSGNTRFFWSYGLDKKPKKVLCADGYLRYMTLALTHSTKSFTVGKFYKFGEVMYQEGTSGYATGNHIHVECCAGHVKTKVRNSNGAYTLANMMDTRKVFFILDSYTKRVISTCGLVFKHCGTTAYTPSTGSATNYVTSPTHQLKRLATGKTYTTAVDGLRSRKGDSTKAPIIATMKKGQALHYYGYYAMNGSQPWLWVGATINGKYHEGFVCPNNGDTIYLNGYEKD